MSAILPPHMGRSAQQNRKLKTLARGQRAAQLVNPTPVPASPFGGNGPPASDWYIPVIGASFGVQATQPWIISLDRIVRTGFAVDLPWRTGAATTGEVRLTLLGIASTDVISLGAGSSGTASFRWLHPMEPWVNTFVWIYVEARRTAGANTVSIGYPPGGGR